MKKNFLKNNIFIIIIIIVFIFVIGFYAIREYLASKSIYTDSTLTDSKYEMIPKTYGINEYAPVLISDENMAKIYLNDYINIVNTNTEESYYLLDEEYRNTKFNSLDEYLLYTKTIKNYSHDVSSYYKKVVDDYIIYGIYDEYGDFFGFKTNGVMQYVVYLDEYTIEIW